MNYNNQPQNQAELLERFEGWGEVYNDGSDELYLHEDDGNFFLEQFGVRLCPDLSVDQESSRSEFNRAVNAFLRQMGYPANYNERGMV